MGKFVAGDIIVVPFPFTDLTQFKKRPALIIKETGNGDYMCMMITSKAYSPAYSIEILSSDYVVSTLPVKSFIRYNRIFEANEQIILKKATSLTQAATNTAIKKLIAFLQP